MNDREDVCRSGLHDLIGTFNQWLPGQVEFDFQRTKFDQVGRYTRTREGRLYHVTVRCHYPDYVTVSYSEFCTFGETPEESFRLFKYFIRSVVDFAGHRGFEQVVVGKAAVTPEVDELLRQTGFYMSDDNRGYEAHPVKMGNEYERRKAARESRRMNLK